ncbi:MAG: hypothetical protein ACKO3M_08205, partial [Rubrivivax sp.]
VVDLHELLAGTPCPQSLSARIAVVEVGVGAGARKVGLLACGFSRLIAAHGDGQPGLSIPDRPYLIGLVQDGSDTVQLVDAERLLGAEWLRMLDNDSAGGSAEAHAA